MPNTLGNYNPPLFAQLALIQLEKALGLASRVHLGYDEERRIFDKGDTINIRRPGVFSVNDAPSSPQDLSPESVSIVLDQWKEVKFKLTDKELAYTQERMIDEHIRPAAVALADYIDQQLASLYKFVPWVSNMADTTAVVGDITAIRRIMFDNRVPLRDGPSRVHLMLSGEREEKFLNLSAFSQQQGAGDTGIATQRTGTLAEKFGFEIFTNQNTPSHTQGTVTTGDPSGTLATATVTKGLTSITIEALTNGETVKVGDTFVIAGNTQRYTVQTDATVATAAITINIFPALAITYSAGAVVTFDSQADKTNQCIAFHRDAFALAFARLPQEIHNRISSGLVASVQDPITGIALRSSIYGMPDTSDVRVKLDVLFGFKTLNPNLAVRGRSKP